MPWWFPSVAAVMRGPGPPPVVNIELEYTTFRAVRLVLGVDDVDKTRAAL